MTNRSGGSSSTASPSMPAWTGAVAVTSSCFAVHVRPALWPAAGRSSTRTPSCPLSRAGRVPGARGGSKRVGVVRDEHDRGVAMRAAAVVHELQAGCRRARSEHLRGRLRERARLGVAVRRLPNRVAVDPERDVVEEEAAVHLGDVDPALDAVGEGVERADQIAAVDADVEREVVAGAGGDADEREGRARERLRPRRRATRRRRRRRARPRRAPRRRRRALRGRRPGAGRSRRCRARAPARRGRRAPPCRHRTSG